MEETKKKINEAIELAKAISIENIADQGAKIIESLNAASASISKIEQERSSKRDNENLHPEEFKVSRHIEDYRKNGTRRKIFTPEVLPTTPSEPTYDKLLKRGV